MNKIYIIIFLLMPLFIYSQNEDNDCYDLKSGAFELYNEDQKTGIIYRKGKYQIEKYPNDEKLTIVKVKSKKCSFILNNYNIKEDLDTITWAVSYKKIIQDHYSFIGKPLYLEIDFKYEGKLLKISNKITDQRILNAFIELKATEESNGQY